MSVKNTELEIVCGHLCEGCNFIFRHVRIALKIPPSATYIIYDVISKNYKKSSNWPSVKYIRHSKMCRYTILISPSQNYH